MDCFNFKGGCGINARISRHLKEELTWAIDKWLWLIINTMLFKRVIHTTKKLKNEAVLNLKQCFMQTCPALHGLW